MSRILIDLPKFTTRPVINVPPGNIFLSDGEIFLRYDQPHRDRSTGQPFAGCINLKTMTECPAYGTAVMDLGPALISLDSVRPENEPDVIDGASDE